MEDEALIRSCMNQHFFMRNLDSKAKTEVIKNCSLSELDKNQIIFKEEHDGNYFYIIKEGKVRLFSKNQTLKFLEKGESFGELALIHGGQRSCSIESVTKCQFYLIDRFLFRKIIDGINLANYKENKSFIERVHLLSSLQEDQKVVLCDNLVKEIYKSGEVIIKEGERGNCLFIIKEGCVECLKYDEVLRVLHNQEVFGETALLTDRVRSMTVKAKDEVTVYSVSIETLLTMMGPKYRELLLQSFIIKSFKKSKLCKNFDLSFLNRNFQIFSLKYFEDNEVVVVKGEEKNKYVRIVIEGGLKRDNLLIANRGEILNELELVNNVGDLTEEDIVACPDCLVASADASEFCKLAGSSLVSLVNTSEVVMSLKSIQLFKNFDQNKLENLSFVVLHEKYAEKEEIIRQGEEGSSLFFIKSGKVSIYSQGVYIRTLTQGEYLGERALFFRELRSATAIADTEVDVYKLNKEEFLSIIDVKMQKFLEERFHLRDDTVKLEDLMLVRIIGAGSIGKVCLVQSNRNKHLYAIKSVDKEVIDKFQSHENIEMERKILLQLDHPFIVKLVKTMKKDSTIYFLMEYVEGKELFEIMKEVGILKPSQAQFLFATLLETLNFLHTNSFVYRDLKPENIIITSEVVR